MQAPQPGAITSTPVRSNMIEVAAVARVARDVGGAELDYEPHALGDAFAGAIGIGKGRGRRSPCPPASRRCMSRRRRYRSRSRPLRRCAPHSWGRRRFRDRDRPGWRALAGSRRDRCDARRRRSGRPRRARRCALVVRRCRRRAGAHAIHSSMTSSHSMTAPRAVHSVAMLASVARSSGLSRNSPSASELHDAVERFLALRVGGEKVEHDVFGSDAGAQ